MAFKTCSACGAEKPIEAFRPYYGGRKGTYRYCRTCERIMQREKYLIAKGDAATQQEREELEKIHKLYSIRETKGLKPPRYSKDRVGATDLIDQLLAKESTE